MKLSLKQMIADLERHGWTQEKIESATEIAQSSISKLKNGRQTSVFHEKADSLRNLYKTVVKQKAQSGN